MFINSDKSDLSFSEEIISYCRKYYPWSFLRVPSMSAVLLMCAGLWVTSPDKRRLHISWGSFSKIINYAILPRATIDVSIRKKMTEENRKNSRCGRCCLFFVFSHAIYFAFSILTRQTDYAYQQQLMKHVYKIRSQDYWKYWIKFGPASPIRCLIISSHFLSPSLHRSRASVNSM
jgi:hypothetical protein